VYRRSLVRPHAREATDLLSQIEAFTHAARKDSAVHVSLSSYSPIKQPGAHTPLPGHARETAKREPPTRVGGRFTGISEELRGRAIPPSGGAPCEGYICRPLGYCQPSILEFFIRPSWSGETWRNRGCSPAAPEHLVICFRPTMVDGPEWQGIRRRTLATILRRASHVGEMPGTSSRLRYSINAKIQSAQRKNPSVTWTSRLFVRRFRIIGSTVP
jgi:hypothetical protein